MASFGMKPRLRDPDRTSRHYRWLRSCFPQAGMFGDWLQLTISRYLFLLIQPRPRVFRLSSSAWRKRLQETDFQPCDTQQRPPPRRTCHGAPIGPVATVPAIYLLARLPPLT